MDGSRAVPRRRSRSAHTGTAGHPRRTQNGLKAVSTEPSDVTAAQISIAGAGGVLQMICELTHWRAYQFLTQGLWKGETSIKYCLDKELSELVCSPSARVRSSALIYCLSLRLRFRYTCPELNGASSLHGCLSRLTYTARISTAPCDVRWSRYVCRYSDPQTCLREENSGLTGNDNGLF